MSEEKQPTLLPHEWLWQSNEMEWDNTLIKQYAEYWADQQTADLRAEIERLKAEKWVSVEDKVPNEFQSVAFVVVSHNESYNNRVLGGTYLGIKGGIHEFAIPGIGFEAEFWQPLPSPPNIFKSTK